MRNKLRYNQMKLIRFVASISLLCVYVLDIAAKPYLPKTLLKTFFIVAVILYIASNHMFIGGQRKSAKVLMDELSKQNEARAAQFTNLLLTAAVSWIILITNLIDKNITLSNDVLFCVVIAISAVNDGYYLYLEGRVGKDADTDDEN